MIDTHSNRITNCIALRLTLSSATQPTKQTTHMHAIYPSTLIALSLTLTACGGGDDANTSAPATNSPPSTTLSGNLSIKINNQAAKTIQPRKTTEDAEYPAYQLITQLKRAELGFSTFQSIDSSLNQIQKLEFSLNEEGSSTLTANIDPINQQLIGLSLVQTAQNAGTTTADYFNCSKNSLDTAGCQNVSLSIAAQTGRVALNFNQTNLQQNNRIGVATLNGTLTGELSHAPQNLNSIPKTSQANLSVDGKAMDVIASTYIPNVDRVELLLKDQNVVLVSFFPDQTLQSSLVDLNNTPATGYLLQNTNQVSTQSTATQTTLDFNQAEYQTTSVLAASSKKLNGQVTLRKPTQTLSISPWFKSPTNAAPVTRLNNTNVSVINHQGILLSDRYISVRLQAGQVQSVKIESLEQDFSDPSSFMIRLVGVEYECQKTACQGIQVEPNGFGVKFNNTTLTRVGNDDALNPTIALNGGLIYLGR